MTVAVIVQARRASTRLPDKVLKRLAGETVLSHVLRRCAAVPGADAVCCAIPDDPACDALAGEAGRAGATVFRGSEQDVLARTAGAAEALGAGTVLRVTSDCPLIDPEICGQVLALHRE
ncbi:MAG: NTP transferase domain-containing protein, partial [Inquilinus sp.]|nr:NTP transferase domain-containing protein [Inquilinus sp.]